MTPRGINICKKTLQSCYLLPSPLPPILSLSLSPRLLYFLRQWVELAVAPCLLAFHWSSRPPRTPPPPEACGRRPWSSRTPRSPPPPRVRDLRGTPPLARRSLCSTLAAAHAEGRSSRRVEEDERRDGGPREAPPPEPVRRRDGRSRALEQSRAEQPGPAPPWAEQPPRRAQAGPGAARPL